MIKVRKAKLADINECAKLIHMLLEMHIKFDKYYTPIKDINKQYKKLFKLSIYSKNFHTLVAEKEGKIIGFGMAELSKRPPVFAERNIGYFSDMFILPKYRKSGIGKKMFNEIIKWFKSKKIKHIEVDVHVKNEIGQKAWNKYGFKDHSVKKLLKL